MASETSLNEALTIVSGANWAAANGDPSIVAAIQSAIKEAMSYEGDPVEDMVFVLDALRAEAEAKGLLVDDEDDGAGEDKP